MMPLIKRQAFLSYLLVLIFISNGYGQGEIRVLSANVRVALHEDDLKGVGWEDRKDIVMKVIKRQNPDIICLQEVIEVQNIAFKQYFKNFQILGYEGPEMDVYKDQDYHQIAKNPILYNKKKYELIAAGQYWLSDKPLLGGSKSWQTSRARNVNWIRLKEKRSGKQFRVLNTHLDHRSQEAQLSQVKMILEEARQYQEDFPQILAGDFNADSKNETIKNIKMEWKDSYHFVNPNLKPEHTYHAFEGVNAKSEKGKIDFIFTRGTVFPTEATIIKDCINERYPSDHYFITATMHLE